MLIEEISRSIKAELYNPHNIDFTSLDITGVKSLKSAGRDHLSFYDQSRPKQELLTTKAGVVILEKKNDKLPLIQLIAKQPKLAMCQVLKLFVKEKVKTFTGISQEAFIHPEAKVHPEATVYPMVYVDKKATIGAGTTIYPHSYIGEGVSIGTNSTLYSHVSLLNACQLGNHITIHPGTVIGAEGFGFIPTAGKTQKIPQLGRVIIEDHVQIGSLCNIDSATFDETLIQSGTKIDAHVQIAHNVTLGKDNILCAKAALAGGSSSGDHVVLAGKVAVNNGVHIDSHTTVGALAGVTNHLKKGTYLGFPATEAREWRKSMVLQRKLPELFQEVKELKKKIKTLENLRKSENHE